MNEIRRQNDTHTRLHSRTLCNLRDGMIWGVVRVCEMMMIMAGFGAIPIKLCDNYFGGFVVVEVGFWLVW